MLGTPFKVEGQRSGKAWTRTAPKGTVGVGDLMHYARGTT